MSTKRIIADQTMFRLNAGWPDIAQSTQKEDIFKALEQKINSLFKLQQFSVTLASGGTIPDNLAIANYEGITVTRTTNERSKATLPIMPISLPLNAGVHEIRPLMSAANNADRMLGFPFIPLQAGQFFLLSADTLLNDLMGQVGYEVQGKTVVFTKDLTSMGVSKVDMKLVVLDMSQYSETDLLPVPADMEDQLVNELVQQFAGSSQPETGAVQKTNSTET
jgi:hypothetical protein